MKAPGTRLLVLTQAVDLDDPILGFFHQWLVEFSKRIKTVHVVCLKEGRHDLPPNIFVHTLGKEAGRSRLKYVWNFYRYIFALRNESDSVFVHMNPEYVVLGGWFWRLRGKRIGLWFIHPKISWWLRAALPFVHVVLSATEKSFPLQSSKVRALGIGVDTDFFTPTSRAASDTLRVMQAARIAPVKRIETVIDAAHQLEQSGVRAEFDLYGEALPRDAEYDRTVREQARTVPSFHFKGAVRAEAIRDAYQQHDVHVNATTTGSFDKAVIESMACGCIPVVSNTALADMLPASLLFKEGDASSLADVLQKIARMKEQERSALEADLRSLVVSQYSLSRIVAGICRELES